MNKIASFLILIVFLLGLTSPVAAQDDSTGNPIYIVKAGDTLWTIARNLHVSYAELLALNGLDENSSIIPGTRLEIPGLNGSGGVVSTVRLKSRSCRRTLEPLLPHFRTGISGPSGKLEPRPSLRPDLWTRWAAVTL